MSKEEINNRIKQLEELAELAVSAYVYSNPNTTIDKEYEKQEQKCFGHYYDDNGKLIKA